MESGISNKSATIGVDYDENGGNYKVDICLNDYVLDKVKKFKEMLPMGGCQNWYKI